MNRVILIACTNVGHSIIEEIYTNPDLKEIDLVGVVNLKPSIAINKANYDPYTDLIEKYNLNMFYCDNVNDKECIDFIYAAKPDIIIQSGWSQKFSDELLAIPTYACIGEHPAPLPKGRGAACVNWAIITGEKEWGDTFFKMEKTYDTGVIYAQNFFDIEIYDDVKTVYDKVALAAVKSVRDNILDWGKGVFRETNQDDEKSTHYPKRKPSDGQFDFSQSAISIYNQIRGQARPYPGAFFEINSGGENKIIHVWKASLDVSKCDDGGVNVLCGDGRYIRLLRVQVDKNPEEWAVDCGYL